MGLLNIFSLNCSFVPSIKNNIDNRIDKIVKHILDNDYNVICLQESFFYKFSDRQLPEQILLKKLNELTSDNWYISSNKKKSLFEKTKILNTGLVVISKFKITKSKFNLLPTNIAWNFLFFIRPWYFQECELEIEDKKVTIFNIHLTPAINKLAKLIDFEKFKINQIMCIYYHILQNIYTPWVINGDWNMNPKKIIDSNFFNKCLLSYEDKNTTHLNMKFKLTEIPPQETLDYIVIKNLTIKNPVKVIDDNTISDHYPISYKLEI